MILRVYRIPVEPAKVAEYEEFERGEGLRMVRSMDGCLGCGFGPVKEEKGTYVFFSLWRDQDSLEAARATPTWKRVTGKVDQQGLSRGGDAAQHVDVKASWGFGASR